MKDVILLKGMFYDFQMKGKEYLFFLDVDCFLVFCYEVVLQMFKKLCYGGWEVKEIVGYLIGYWLFVVLVMYQVFGDEKLKRKVEYVVNELSYI